MATCAIIPGKGGASFGAVRDGMGARTSNLIVDPDQMRPAEYLVYIHSISKRDFNQPNPIFNNVYLRACPADQPYITVWAKWHPIGIPTLDPDNVSGPPKMVYVNAKGAALSICNPSYVGNDLSVQQREIPAWAQISSGECNLTRQGVFASLNEIPTSEELKRAEKNRHDYYQFRFKEANEMAQSNPAGLQDLLMQDHHMAAEMFDEDVSWHRIVSPKMSCPNCGEKIKAGIAFHFSNGARCVLDWERAHLAGVVKKDEVPESLRWWDEDDKPKRRTGISAAAAEISAQKG